MALIKPVSPSAAMTESGVRTLVDLGVGFVLTWLTQEIVKRTANTGVIWSETEVWTVLMAFYTAASAVVKRKLWPVQTDNANVGRTDLPPVPPAPLP